MDCFQMTNLENVRYNGDWGDSQNLAENLHCLVGCRRVPINTIWNMDEYK
jgi:hypothetical protein